MQSPGLLPILVAGGPSLRAGIAPKETFRRGVRAPAEVGWWEADPIPRCARAFKPADVVYLWNPSIRVRSPRAARPSQVVRAAIWSQTSLNRPVMPLSHHRAGHGVRRYSWEALVRSCVLGARGASKENLRSKPFR